MSRSTLDTALSSVLSLTGLSPSLAGFPKTILLRLSNHKCGPNPDVHAHRFGLFRFRSPLLPESHVVFSSSGYLDVSVHRVPSAYLWIQYAVTEVFSARFPHSDISGSLDICSSPKLFAAYHVFHRLLVPRHPPCALSRLTIHKCCSVSSYGSLGSFLRVFSLLSSSTFVDVLGCLFPISCVDRNFFLSAFC